MTDAQYLYCIAEEGIPHELGDVGIEGGRVSTIAVKDLYAIVSPVPYRELESSIANIMTHQRVVELVREKSTALPVRFGVIFRSKEGVRALLQKSYSSYVDKLNALRGKDEFGVKLILTPEGRRKLEVEVSKQSNVIGTLTKASAKATKGTAYILKLKTEEAIRNESYRKVDELCRRIDEKLGAEARQSARLKSDHEQIVLNAAYLVERGGAAQFRKTVDRVTKDSASLGLEVHVSGPWAPYSFC